MAQSYIGGACGNLSLAGTHKLTCHDAIMLKSTC